MHLTFEHGYTGAECIGTVCKQMVDVGCGIGGSSRHISRKFGCAAHGITLSPVQVPFLLS